MNEEYLRSVPLSIFYYYIQLYSKRQKQIEFDEFNRNAEAGYKNKKAMPVGNNIPRKQ